MKDNGDCFTINTIEARGVMEYPALDANYYKGVSKQRSALLEGYKVRRLTPLECERLQGFPDGWTEGFSDTQRYKMMGNAVTVNVIRAIAQRLI